MVSIAAHSPAGMDAVDDVATLVVAEDLPTRARICRVLGDQPQISLTTAANADALLTDSGFCDLLIAYSKSLQPEQASLFDQLRDTFSEIRIVAVCDSANGRSTRRAIDGGVDGLVLLDDLEIALAPTVAAVLAGQTALPRDLRALLRKAALSYREKQILGLVVMGYTNSEIGGRLFLAESTVKSHLSSAFGKLGVRSRSEAAALILDPQGSLGAGIMSIAAAAEAPRRAATA
jgi:DNA-binding NarL/FixJ family response regulator